MELNEVKYKFLSIGELCNNILKLNDLSTTDKMGKLVGIQESTKFSFSVSITRLVMDCNFLPLIDDIIPGTTFLSQKIIGKVDSSNKDGKKIFIYKIDSDVGLIPSSVIRVFDGEYKLLHATLNLTVWKSEEEKIVKKLYFNKEFFLTSSITSSEKAEN